MSLASLSFPHETRATGSSGPSLDRLASIIHESFLGPVELPQRIRTLFERLSHEYRLGFGICSLQLASVAEAPLKETFGRRGNAFDDFSKRSEASAHELLKTNLPVFSFRTVETYSTAENRCFFGYPVSRGQKNWGYLCLEFHGLTEEPSKAFVETLSLVSLLLAEEAEIDFFKLKTPRASFERTTGSDALIGSSGAMQGVFRDVETFSRSVHPVLLIGEPGVGKKLVAQVIHDSSPFSSLAFVTGSAIEWASWIESNDSVRSELRRGGTLYLDGIEDVPATVLSKLVVWTRHVHRNPIRLVFSTTKTTESVAKWRAETGPLTIALPPLRERAGDLIALSEHFVRQFSQQFGKKIHGISTPAYEMLFAYYWPGNVRELEEVLERAVFLSQEDLLHAYHLPPNIQTQLSPAVAATGSLQERLDALEYELLTSALRSNQGNMTKTAQELGLTKRIMGLRLQKFNLDYRTFRTR